MKMKYAVFETMEGSTVKYAQPIKLNLVICLIFSLYFCTARVKIIDNLDSLKVVKIYSVNHFSFLTTDSFFFSTNEYEK